MGLGLAAAAMLAQGCVFSIGGGKKEYIVEDRTRLTSDQQDDALTVRSKADVPSFSQAENARLGKLGPDTTVDQFRKIFPEAVYRGSKDVNGETALIYEVRDRRVYRYEGSSYGMVHDEPVFFRFVGGTLEGWYHASKGGNFPSWWSDSDMGEHQNG
ncbi:hypothetical protein AY599_03015 [Leptolyngbya valderiana BDU 20041]|nr:hypothetical protein AY599_03015 [Leptolyngbya valderiana BDU 20041]